MSGIDWSFRASDVVVIGGVVALAWRNLMALRDLVKVTKDFVDDVPKIRHRLANLRRRMIVAEERLDYCDPTHSFRTAAAGGRPAKPPPGTKPEPSGV